MPKEKKPPEPQVETEPPLRKTFLNRPHQWWTQPRALWRPHWSESEIPEGEKVSAK